MASTGTTTADLLSAIRAPRRARLSPLPVICAMLLLVACVGASLLISAILSERAEIDRLGDISVRSERLLFDLKDAESGQRGYLLTGQDRYLVPYRAALARLGDNLAALQNAVRPERPIVSTAATLNRLVSDKLEELAHTIAMRQAGDAAGALDVVESGRGQALMEDARAEVASLAAGADRARAASDATIRRWLWAGTASALAFLSLGVALVFRLRRERASSALALSRSELSFRAALDAIPQIVWSARADGRHDYFNRRWHEFTGARDEQDAAQSWNGRLHPEDRDRVVRRWRECVTTGTAYEAEQRLQAAGGGYVWTLARALPVRDPDSGTITRWYGTSTDINELLTARSALTEALDLKEMLLHEVNHRVKNSLQLVSSLLALQAGKARTPELRDVLADARTRVSVIARLHQRLYQDGTHDSVDLLAFLRELCSESVAALQGADAIALTFEASGGGAVLLPIDRAVPIALIVSELLTNSVKHAFPEGGGALRVSVGDGGDELRIRVEDDGPGLPEPFDVAAAHGVGMRVINALVRQLRGRIQPGTANSGRGASFLLVVPRADS